VLVVEVVESVRLIEQDEEGVIARWFGLVNHVESDLLAAGEGQLVKCLGDGGCWSSWTRARRWRRRSRSDTPPSA
jgi:hypothetical protein